MCLWKILFFFYNNPAILKLGGVLPPRQLKIGENGMRRLFMLMMVFWLVVPLGAQAGGFGGKDDPSGVPGQWYVGNTPASVHPAKPVVVFVHGFNSSSNRLYEELPCPNGFTR